MLELTAEDEGIDQGDGDLAVFAIELLEITETLEEGDIVNGKLGSGPETQLNAIR